VSARGPGWLIDLRGDPVPYAEAWALQHDLLQARQAGTIPDSLILLEHAPVVTLGRSAKAGHLLLSPKALAARGIELFEVERGGDVTYHGPGQLVGYPILDLRALQEDVVRYMRLLEESVIATLAAFGIAGARLRGYPGVWVDGAKVCAVGVAVKRRVTMHGFALNVTPDLDSFAVINPCGLSRPVTSMAAILGRAVAVDDVRGAYAGVFSRVFGIGLTPADPAAVSEARAGSPAPLAPAGSR
jgi:lipoate-protein ligase B